MYEQQPGIKYPDAISRDPSEGGFRFLTRVFRKNIDSGKPITINTGNMYFQYHYSPEHTTFEQGMTLLDGNPSDETMNVFMDVVKSFNINDAITEGRYTRQADGSLKKLFPVPPSTQKV